MASNAILPLPASTSVYLSQAPTAVRLAISGLAPALSAQTYWLSDRARRPIFPLPASTTANCSAVPTEVLLAIRAVVELAAVTYLPSAIANSETVVPGTSFLVTPPCQLFPVTVALKPLDRLTNADVPAFRPVTVLPVIEA